MNDVVRLACAPEEAERHAGPRRAGAVEHLSAQRLAALVVHHLDGEALAGQEIEVVRAEHRFGPGGELQQTLRYRVGFEIALTVRHDLDETTLRHVAL